MSPTIFLFLLPLNFILISAIPTSKFYVPRLSPTAPKTLEHYSSTNKRSLMSESSSISEDMETYFYNQTLDHFNFKPESFQTFQQRYLMSSKNWGGGSSSSPIFVYLGAEAPLEYDLPYVGFLSDNAPRFNALQLYIEHRYYGESIPVGMEGEALRNSSNKGYLNSAQAIADYAEIIIFIKQKLNAQNSPVIVIGGSYGGMLASWFRLKYPHIALGALASSAPILNFYDITPSDIYYSIVTKDFRDESETCYATIKKSWAEIDEVASKPNGLQILNNKFKTCQPLMDSSELKFYLDSIFCNAAQYNEPPRYPVKVVCKGIDDTNGDSDILSRIFSGIVSLQGNRSCYLNPSTVTSETSLAWDWQTCSEMVGPIERANDTMFPPSPLDLNGFLQECKDYYGISARLHWVPTYYGGHDIKLILQDFGSNIIFSNGLRDPYSRSGILESISDTIIAVSTTNGSHCLDIQKANATTDPDWLVTQRKTEINIIDEWINKYYNDLLQIKKSSRKMIH
ncbi:Serine carboxypeptidase S28 family protein [Euphorbia peplus]|nr:Serine carboxypeptidase S28 family protein [Euphorbia peplus]